MAILLAIRNLVKKRTLCPLYTTSDVVVDWQGLLDELTSNEIKNEKNLELLKYYFLNSLSGRKYNQSLCFILFYLSVVYMQALIMGLCFMVEFPLVDLCHESTFIKFNIHEYVSSTICTL